MAERVAVPRLYSRSATMWLSGVATVVAVVGVLVWAVLTQPVGNVIAGFVAVLILVGLLGFLIGRRTWLDTGAGAVGRDVWGLLPRTVPWAGAGRVQVVGNRGGQALLEVRTAGARTSVFLPLVAVDVGGDRSQEPAFLRTLADEIARWAPERTTVVRALVGQAEHLEAGGSVRDSPLARRYLASEH